jgi:hypothetical protein
MRQYFFMLSSQGYRSFGNVSGSGSIGVEHPPKNNNNSMTSKRQSGNSASLAFSFSISA